MAPLHPLASLRKEYACPYVALHILGNVSYTPPPGVVITLKLCSTLCSTDLFANLWCEREWPAFSSSTTADCQPARQSSSIHPADVYLIDEPVISFEWPFWSFKNYFLILLHLKAPSLSFVIYNMWLGHVSASVREALPHVLKYSMELWGSPTVEGYVGPFR